MPIELTPRPAVMHIARWIESLVQQGEDLGKITAAVEITVGEPCPTTPERYQDTIGRLRREQDGEHD
ncbi:MAG: hypothetical protein GY856_36995 [bacterium]|nr:hypothetical protein [bacterium]